MMNKSKNKKILVIEEVEDDASLRGVLHDKFSLEGFSVLEAKDGEEGLATALSEHPDLILLDIIMPKMDGITMLKKLREDTWGKEAKVIILTNLGDDKKLLDAMGPDSYEVLLKSAWKIEAIVQKVRDKLTGMTVKPKKSHETLTPEERVIERTRQLAEKTREAENAQKAVLDIWLDLKIEKEQLAEAKAKDEAILASIADGCIAVNKNGEIILVNQMAEKMLGYTSKESIGKQWHEILHREDENGSPISPEKGAIHAALSSSTTTHTVTSFYYLRKDGTRFPISRTVSPIILQNKIIGAVNIFQDITHEKEIDRAKSEFISIASHQLRTPVSALNWLTEALQFTSQNFNPKQTVYLRDLSSMTKRLVALVEDLLNFSRLELKSATTTEKHKIEIPAFIEEFTKDMETYAVSKKHSLVLNNEITEPIIIEINKKALYNILQNLTSNAINYSPENTAVTTNLEKTDDSIKISISNKGSVIPKEEQPRLFERFYRGESAKKIKTEGTGLGLYIVKAEIEAIGGKVGFESVEGKDTMFWFTIPLKVTNKS